MQKFKPFNFNRNQLFFGLCVFINIAYLLAPNHKYYLGFTALFCLIAFVLHHSNWYKALFLTLILTLPFEHGLRDFHLSVLSPNPWLYNPGYSVYFGFSLKLFLSLALLCFSLLHHTRAPIPFAKLEKTALLVWIGATLISSFIAPSQELAWTGWLKLSVAISCFLVTKIVVAHDSSIEKSLVTVVVSSIIIQSGVAVVQTLTQSPLGLPMIEDTASISYHTTDGKPYYRAAGLMGHPTFLGSYLSSELSIYLTGLFYTLNITGFFTGALITLSGIAIFGTYSRSAWLLSLVIAGGYFYHFRPQFRWDHCSFPKRLMVALLVGWILYNIPSAIDRLSTLSSVFSSGSGVSRLHQLAAAFQIIGQFPWFGAGLNQFVAVMAQNYSLSQINGYLFPVHHSLILFAAETGLPATIGLITLISVILYRSFPRKHHSPLHYAAWMAVVAFLINSQVHPLFPQDSSFEYAMVWLGYLSTKTFS